MPRGATYNAPFSQQEQLNLLCSQMEIDGLTNGLKRIRDSTDYSVNSKNRNKSTVRGYLCGPRCFGQCFVSEYSPVVRDSERIHTQWHNLFSLPPFCSEWSGDREQRISHPLKTLEWLLLLAKSQKKPPLLLPRFSLCNEAEIRAPLGSGY